jgi:CRP-like cAMP-binding protein
MATATATSDCVLVTLLDFSIKEITKKHPDLLDKIMSIIESRVLKNKIIENQSRFS